MSIKATRPIADRIIVRPEHPEDVTPGGIVLPDAAQEGPTRGKVVAVGSGRMLESGSRVPMEVSEGDDVVFGAYGGVEIGIDGEQFVVLREAEVLYVC